MSPPGLSHVSIVPSSSSRPSSSNNASRFKSPNMSPSISRRAATSQLSSSPSSSTKHAGIPRVQRAYTPSASRRTSFSQHSSSRSSSLKPHNLVRTPTDDVSTVSLVPSSSSRPSSSNNASRTKSPNMSPSISGRAATSQLSSSPSSSTKHPGIQQLQRGYTPSASRRASLSQHSSTRSSSFKVMSPPALSPAPTPSSSNRTCLVPPVRIDSRLGKKRVSSPVDSDRPLKTCKVSVCWYTSIIDPQLMLKQTSSSLSASSGSIHIDLPKHLPKNKFRVTVVADFETDAQGRYIAPSILRVSDLVAGSCKVSNIEQPVRIDDVFGAAPSHEDRTERGERRPSSSRSNDRAAATVTNLVSCPQVRQLQDADKRPVVSHSASPSSRPQIPIIPHSSSHPPMQEGVDAREISGQHNPPSSSGPNHPPLVSRIDEGIVSPLAMREAPTSCPMTQTPTVAGQTRAAGGSNQRDYTTEDLDELLCKVAEITRRLTSVRVCAACYALGIPHTREKFHSIEACGNGYANGRDAPYVAWRSKLRYPSAFCYGCCYTRDVSHLIYIAVIIFCEHYPSDRL